MDIKKALEKLKRNKEFLQWKNKNKNTYFSFAFKIPQEMKNDEWQIGYYNKERDKVTTLIVDDESLAIKDEEDVFKENENEVCEIDTKKLKLDYDEILLRASEFQKKNYPKENSIKTITILQNMKDFGNVWNITYITETFNTLNMKIDAYNGKLKEHKLASILSFRQDD